MGRKTTKIVISCVAIATLFVMLQYQNCASPNNGSSVNAQSTTLSVSSPTLNLTTYTPGEYLTAVASVTGGQSSITCQWTMATTPGGILMSPPIPTTIASNNVCSLSGTAPANVGGYSLTLTITNGTAPAASASSVFFSLIERANTKSNFARSNTKTDPYTESRWNSKASGMLHSWLLKLSTVWNSANDHLQCLPFRTNCFLSGSYRHRKLRYNLFIRGRLRLPLIYLS